jgi:hypothetical protein
VKAYIVMISVMFLIGCSGMENNYHKQGNEFKNWRVKYSPHPFSPSVERDYNETCPALKDNPDKPDLEKCVPDIKQDGTYEFQMAKEGGYIGGLAGPVIQAAGFVGGMYVLGSSLRPAQTSNNQSNSSNQTSNNNAQFYDNIPPSGGHALIKK